MGRARKTMGRAWHRLTGRERIGAADKPQPAQITQAASPELEPESRPEAVAEEDGAPATVPDRGAPATVPDRRSVGRWASALGVGVALVIGLLGGMELDGDEGAAVQGPARPAKQQLNRYMTRLGAEWAAFDGVAGQARKKPQYRCGPAQRRLAPVLAELNAIGAPDAPLHADAGAYLAQLGAVLDECLAGRLTGPEVWSRLLDAQTAWAAVRLRALQLGWDTPCGLQPSRSTCAGGAA